MSQEEKPQETQGRNVLPSWAQDPAVYTRLLMVHPLITGTTLIPTAPVEKFCNKIYRGVILRQQGLCFTAISGTGKTSALVYVKDYLETRIPNLVVYLHSTHNYQVDSIRAFFKFFLDSVGSTELKGETADLRNRLVKKIQDDAVASGYNMGVLLIDEAQKMSIKDFYFLKDTINDLDKARIGFVTVLMAQAPDFDEVYNLMKTNHKLDLFSRFALYRTTFDSLRTLQDVTKLFTHIDETRYSADFPVRWTEFFFPIAYSWGFRLANEAPHFFESFVSTCNELNLPVEFPARQTFFVIRAYLTLYAGLDSREMTLPEDRWQTAIMEGKMAEALEVANQNGGSVTVTT
jgi:hypothetical protein